MLVGALAVPADAVFWADPDGCIAMSRSAAEAAVRKRIPSDAANDVVAAIKVRIDNPFRWLLSFDGTSVIIGRRIIYNAPGGAA